MNKLQSHDEAADSLPAGGAGVTGRREGDLDRDRAASMADEGGASGAVVELQEQRSALEIAPVSDISRSWGRRLLWGALALGAAVFALGAARAYRRRS